MTRNVAGLWLFARRQRHGSGYWAVAAAVSVAMLLLLIGTAVDGGLGARQLRQQERDALGGPRTQVLSQPTNTGALALILLEPGAAGSGPRPAPGQMLVSPALAKKLHNDPFLSARLPWAVGGQLDRSFLVFPSELAAVVGLPQRRAHVADDRASTSSAPAAPSQSLVEIITLALVLPSLVLIAAAFRFQARRRERQLATLRLVGASPRQLRQLAVLEGLLVIVPAALFSVPVAIALRPGIARLLSFFSQDLTVSPLTVIALAIGAPTVSIIGAQLGLRKLIVTPFAVQRRTAHKPVSLLRLLPPVAGLALLFSSAAAARTISEGTLALGEGVAIVLIVLGLVISGPALVRLLAGAVPTRLVTAPLLIATRHLCRDPVTAFRGVAVLSVTTFLFAFLSTLDLNAPAETPFASPDVVVELLGQPAGPLLSQLARTPGVTAVAPMGFEKDPQAPGPPVLLTTCAGLPVFDITVAGRCAPGSLLLPANSAQRTPRPQGSLNSAPLPSSGTFTAPAKMIPIGAVLPMTDADIGTRDLARLLIRTDGRTTTTNRVVAAAGLLAPVAISGPPRIAYGNAQEAEMFAQNIRAVMGVIILVTLAAVLLSVAEGLAERRPQITLLSALGMDARHKRRWVAAEVGIPVATAIVPGMAAALLATLAGSLLPGAQFKVSALDLLLPFTLAVCAAAIVVLLLTASTRSRIDPEYLRTD